MLVVIADLHLLFPFLHITVHHLEALWLTEVNAYCHLLVTDIQFYRFTLDGSLFLVLAKSDVLDFLHFTELISNLDGSGILQDKGLRFLIKLDIFLLTHTILLDLLLDCFTILNQFQFLIRKFRILTLDVLSNLIGHQAHVTVLSSVEL